MWCVNFIEKIAATAASATAEKKKKEKIFRFFLSFLRPNQSKSCDVIRGNGGTT